MVMKNLHEGPSSGHFATEIMQRKTLHISGHLCTGTSMILVMHVKEQQDWQFKVLQSWSQVF
jgi:hypothetical protein